MIDLLDLIKSGEKRAYNQDVSLHKFSEEIIANNLIEIKDNKCLIFTRVNFYKVDFSFFKNIKHFHFDECVFKTNKIILPKGCKSITIISGSSPYYNGSSNIKSFKFCEGLDEIAVINSSDINNSDLKYFREIDSVNLSGCKNINNISYLSNCKSINISYTNVSDISSLYKVKILNMTSCPVKDVSSLEHVYELNLMDCKGVIDVSALGNVHILNLQGTNVIDVSSLGNVYNLNLAKTPVSDVSKLVNVHTLYLNDCKNINDVSTLGGCYELSILGTKVSDVSSLGKVNILDISYTPVEDILPIKDVPNLTVNYCDNVRDFNPISNSENNITYKIR